MTTVDFLDKLLQALDEIVIPAIAAYAVYLVKVWVERQKGGK